MYIFFARTINPSEHDLAIIAIFLNSLHYQNKHSLKYFANSSALSIQTKKHASDLTLAPPPPLSYQRQLLSIIVLSLHNTHFILLFHS